MTESFIEIMAKSKLTEEEYELFQERAAIIEFDGNQSRIKSEILAYKKNVKQEEI